MNLRKIDTVIKDGKVADRAYHSWYAGWMFAHRDNDDDAVIAAKDWTAALKKATWRPNAKYGRYNAAGGFDSELSPTPGIEAISLHTVLRRGPDTPLTLTGFNFVRGSRVTFDGIPVPTEVRSRTEIRITIPENLLGRAGLMPLAVRNPQPLADPEWGDTSNTAYVLVPFEFTEHWSHNAY
jgi:hypothetical protein